MKFITSEIKVALEKLGIQPDDIAVTLLPTADFSHGDYATNIALLCAKRVGAAPVDLARRIVAVLGEIKEVAKIEVAGPGFINFTLDPRFVFEKLEAGRVSGEKWGGGDVLRGIEVMVEYAQPNPFKAFHIGHLMNITIGESLSRLKEFSGAKIVRVNYQGDVGVHIACAIWGMKKLDIHPESSNDFGRAYAEGATAYKENEIVKAEIDALNKKIYNRSDEEINKLYDTGRKESLAAFERIYKVLGTKFDHYFFESETAWKGKEIVLAHPDTFPESDGAHVFKGEEYGLHTRVFLNSQGLPTYEAKELGLEKLKSELYPDSRYLYVVAANEITEYFKVLKKAMELVFPDIAVKLRHIPYGMMRLTEGKMSSRTGNVITGESLIAELVDVAKERAQKSRASNPEQLSQGIAVAAIKFQVLKGSIAKDIIFNREQALSIEGDSGPYLQYTHARTHAIIEKAKDEGVKAKYDAVAEASELVRLVYRFPEVVARAQEELEPHIVTNYLIAIASSFNTWYAQEQILDGTPMAAHKVAITDIVRITLKNGLWLLGISAPEKV